MMLIPCPWCGTRNSTEFHYVGETSSRPDPGATDAREWRTYLYHRTNPAGWVRENWLHRAGCRRYFTIERNTVTNEIAATGGRDD